MNWRWYFTGLIVVLAFLGAGMEQSKLDSNQEIVVWFNSPSISTNEANDAVAEISTQLKAIGVEDIRVSEVENGKVTVTYYSNLDVGIIKRMLYQQNSLHLNDTAFNNEKNSSDAPFSDSSGDYKLEFLKIQTDNTSDVGFQGTLVESKSFGDQYLKPRLSLTASEINFVPRDNFEILHSFVFSVAPLLTRDFPYQIPEVRAGPSC